MLNNTEKKGKDARDVLDDTLIEMIHKIEKNRKSDLIITGGPTPLLRIGEIERIIERLKDYKIKRPVAG